MTEKNIDIRAIKEAKIIGVGYSDLTKKSKKIKRKLKFKKEIVTLFINLSFQNHR